jgi:hypothetical protein
VIGSQILAMFHNLRLLGSLSILGLEMKITAVIFIVRFNLIMEMASLLSCP